MSAYMAAYNSQGDSFLSIYRMFVERVLEFGAGQRGIVTNGQVLGPLGDTETLLTEDIDLLELFVKQKSAKNIKTTLKTMNYKGDK